MAANGYNELLCAEQGHPGLGPPGRYVAGAHDRVREETPPGGVGNQHVHQFPAVAGSRADLQPAAAELRHGFQDARDQAGALEQDGELQRQEIQVQIILDSSLFPLDFNVT